MSLLASFDKNANLITFNSPLTIGDALTVNGNTTVGGLTVLQGSVQVYSSGQFGGNLTTNGVLTCSSLNANTGDINCAGKYLTGGLARPHARYVSASVGTLVSGYGIVNYSTKIYDTHNAVTTGTAWKFTVPTGCGGIYSISACLHPSTGAGIIEVFLNGVSHARIGQQASTGNGVAIGNVILYLTAGQYIDIRANFTALNNTTVISHVQISCLEILTIV